MTNKLKIAFFTEGQYYGHVPRTATGRTDLCWISALDAVHCNIFATPTETFDLGIIIVPKRFDGNLMDVYWHVKRFSNKTAVMQEGNQTIWQDLVINQQFRYLNLLSSVDIIYCHNEYDQKYFKGLIQGSDVRILPTLALMDSVQRDKLSIDERSGTMISGTMCEWYSGMDSFIIAQEFGEPTYAPSMGRKKSEEDDIEELTFLPYMNWGDWMVKLNKVKYGVNLMRTIAAGSFSLNCAMLSIPTVGYNVLDTQRLCFPETSVDIGDLVSARKLAKHLRDNKLFYDHVANYANSMAKDIYGEEQFFYNFYEPFKI